MPPDLQFEQSCSRGDPLAELCAFLCKLSKQLGNRLCPMYYIVSGADVHLHRQHNQHHHLRVVTESPRAYIRDDHCLPTGVPNMR